MSEISPDINTPMFIMSGLGKNACTPGFLTEWVVCRDPDDILNKEKDQMRRMAQNFTPQAALLIKILPKMLEAGRRMTVERAKICEENFKILEAELWDEERIRLYKTTAGFYATMEVLPGQSPANNEFEFVYKLLETKSVKLFPGRVLGACNFIRISLLVNKEYLEEGIKRIKEFLMS